MNNEEKILAMLTEMRSDIADLKATQTEQGKALATLNNKVDRLETVQAAQGELLKELDARSLKSAVLLETEVARDTRLLYEGHSELRRKLDTLATKEQVKELSGDVEVIKAAVSRHSGDINKLKKAL